MNIDGAQYLRDLSWILPELWLCLAGFALLAASPFVKKAGGERLLAWCSVAAQEAREPQPTG